MTARRTRPRGARPPRPTRTGCGPRTPPSTWGRTLDHSLGDHTRPVRHPAPTAPTGLTAPRRARPRSVCPGARHRQRGCRPVPDRALPGAGCFVTEIATVTGTTYSDSGRSPSTAYSYRVRAQDAALNLGPYSTTASATTPAASTGLGVQYSFNEGGHERGGRGREWERGSIGTAAGRPRQVRQRAVVQRLERAGPSPTRPPCG